MIVSACAIESARLLLNSRSRLFPNGLGNRYDQVGRHLQGHHYTGAVGYFDFETYDDVGPGASIAITDYNHGTPGLAAEACWPTSSSACPFTCSTSCRPARRAGALGHKQAMRQWHKRSIVIMGPTQQIPSATGRVTIDPAVKDRWGLPVARIRRQQPSAHL